MNIHPSVIAMMTNDMFPYFFQAHVPSGHQQFYADPVRKSGKEILIVSRSFPRNTPSS